MTNATKTVQKICSIYDQGVITEHQVQNWLSKFYSGNISGRWTQASMLVRLRDTLKELVKYDPQKVLKN